MSESKPQQVPEQMIKRYMFTGLGLIFGAALGFVFKNFELGAGIGLVLGAVIDGLIYRKRNSKI